MAKTEKQHGEIQCGTSVFKENSVIEITGNDEVQYIEQKISVYRHGEPNGRVIYHPARTMSQPFMPGVAVLDMATEGWTCLKSKDEHYYLYVDYQCRQGPERPNCYGGEHSEKFYLYDIKGNNLTPNILSDNSGRAKANKEQDKLWKRLKIYDFIKDGSSIHLEDVHPLNTN
jgi:hypothetical protein